MSGHPATKSTLTESEGSKTPTPGHKSTVLRCGAVKHHCLVHDADDLKLTGLLFKLNYPRKPHGY